MGGVCFSMKYWGGERQITREPAKFKPQTERTDGKIAKEESIFRPKEREKQIRPTSRRKTIEKKGNAKGLKDKGGDGGKES